MKKISLKNLNLKEVEKLSREQLKNVLGGWTSQGTDVQTDPDYGNDSECPYDCTGNEICYKNNLEGSCKKLSNADCVCATLR